MSQLQQLLFETERRVILFNPNTSMPDGSQLGYDGDPNEVDSNNSGGESLLYNCPFGTRYQESNGNQWFKKSIPNNWVRLSGDDNQIGLLIPNNGSGQFNLSEDIDIEKKFHVYYLAKKVNLVESGSLIVTTSKDIVRESEMDDCGIVFSKSIVGGKVILTIQDEVDDGNDIKIKFNTKTIKLDV